MSNAKSRDNIQQKHGDFHGRFQALLLVSSLIGALAFVVVTFLNTAQPAGAQTSSGGRVGDVAGVVGPGIAMTHTLTGTVTVRGVMTDSMNMTHTMTAPDTTVPETSAVAGAATSTFPTITSTLTTRPAQPLTATLAPAATATTMTSGAAPTITVTQAATATKVTTASTAASTTASVTPTVVVTAPFAAATGDGMEDMARRADLQALMDDTLLLVRSHVISMQRQLADNPTPEEVAAMNADMQTLTRIMQRLITMVQRETAGGAPGLAEVPTLAAPATGVMPGMNAGGMAATPMAPATAPGNSAVAPAQSELEAKLQAVSALMLEARQQMQTMMTDGASEAEISEMRAKLEELRFRMREILAEMQAAAGPAPATLDSPIAGAASAAAAGSGMGDMMQGMSGMMENMSSMMNSMMGGMMGDSGSSGMAGMPTTTAAAGAAPAPNTGGTSTDASALVRSAEAGGVTVVVLPLNLNATNASTFDFKVTVDTHTAPLDQNLATVSVLQPPMGGEVASIQWNGPTGGHHVEGTLTFPRTDSMGMPITGPGTLTLVMRNYAEVADRTFAWELGQ